jgi:hypothetical protein
MLRYQYINTTAVVDAFETVSFGCVEKSRHLVGQGCYL